MLVLDLLHRMFLLLSFGLVYFVSVLVIIAVPITVVALL